MESAIAQSLYKHALEAGWILRFKIF